jgi:hypothetical protein
MVFLCGTIAFRITRWFEIDVENVFPPRRTKFPSLFDNLEIGDGRRCLVSGSVKTMTDHEAMQLDQLEHTDFPIFRRANIN